LSSHAFFFFFFFFEKKNYILENFTTRCGYEKGKKSTPVPKMETSAKAIRLRFCQK